MTVSKAVEAEIRRLHFAEHWPVGTIVTQLGIHEEVVRRVLMLLELRAPVAPRARLVDPYMEFISETLEHYPRLRSTRIYDMVKSRGYLGSVKTLRRHVREVRPTPKREAFVRIETLAGEQAQVDWAYVGKFPVLSHDRALWLFVMTLPHSRGMWAEFVLDLSVYSLLRSLVRAGEYFGGHCRQWLFDNAKTVVAERSGDAVRFHPLLLDLGAACHVQLRVCAVRKPNQKGSVERSIRYLRDRFLAARRIVSIEQGNEELLGFFDDVAHPRPHPLQHGTTVLECLEEERQVLLPLPDPAPITDLVTPVAVDKTASVRFDCNVYSVPPAHVGDTLTLVADDRQVRLVQGQSVVAEHQRSWAKRQRIEAPEHRAEILTKKRLAKPARGRDHLRSAVPGVGELFERWVEEGRNVGSMTSRTLKLLDLYGDAMLSAAVAEALARGISDIGALAQICEQRRLKERLPVPIDISLGEHVPDRDVIPHNLEKYDGDDDNE